MKRDITLKEILIIEDSEEIALICCPNTGIPLWTTIRVPLLRMMMEDLLYGVPVAGGGDCVSPRLKMKQLVAITRCYLHNAKQLQSVKQDYPIMLIATGARVVDLDGDYFNNLSDHFVALEPNKTFSIEDLFDWKWPFPRHHKNVLLHTPLRVNGKLRGRLRSHSFREPAKILVDLVVQRASDLLGWDIGRDRRRWLEKICIYGAASFLPRYQIYQSIFKKMRTRLLIKEGACYGGADNACAMLAARNLSIITAEYQHGAISSGHDAYNFAPAIFNSEAYRKTLPDYFLAYGSWWAEQIDAPVKKIAIGSPHRTEILRTSGNIFSTKKTNYLVLGDGVETELYLELCERLTITIGSVGEVVFRPHPLERVKVFAKYPSGFVGQVRIDSNQDIYSSFLTCLAVISEVSTGLFEAIGLVPKIFIWNTQKARFGYPVHPFQSFSDAEQLGQLVLDEIAGRVSAERIETIWAPQWQENYLEFIKKVNL
jgi:hypothetical protein